MDSDESSSVMTGRREVFYLFLRRVHGGSRVEASPAGPRGSSPDLNLLFLNLLFLNLLFSCAHAKVWNSFGIDWSSDVDLSPLSRLTRCGIHTNTHAHTHTHTHTLTCTPFTHSPTHPSLTLLILLSHTKAERPHHGVPPKGPGDSARASHGGGGSPVQGERTQASSPMPQSRTRTLRPHCYALLLRVLSSPSFSPSPAEIFFSEGLPQNPAHPPT
jgi:hypothetical protein